MTKNLQTFLIEGKLGGLLLTCISRYLVVVFIFTVGLVTQVNEAKATPNRYAALVVDGVTGKILHAENAYERRHPASLVKKMTLYLLFEALKAGKINLNTQFKTSRLANKQIPCKLGLRTGDTISVESIIKGMVTKSANDASVVFAEGYAGNLANFVKLMNKKAKELGMHSTRFFNPSGVPDSRQITTAMDMAILAQALYRDFPEYCHYFQTKRFSYLGISHNNHNHMLGKFPGLDGIKTGFTCASGFNISTSAVRYDANNRPRRLFAVVMGGENRHVRDRRAAQLLEVSFRKIGASSVVKLSKPHTVPGTKGAIKVDRKTTHIQPNIEIDTAEDRDESIQSDSTVEQHSPLGVSPRATSIAKTDNVIGPKDSSILEASLKRQDLVSQPSPAQQQLGSQLVQVNATDQNNMNYQHGQTQPGYMQNPGYVQQPGYAQNNVQVPIKPVQVVTPSHPQPQAIQTPTPAQINYPSSQQMLDYVKTTEVLPTPNTAPTKASKSPLQPMQRVNTVKQKAPLKAERVTTLADSAITNTRSLPENWVIPKAPVSEVKSSLAPTKVSKTSSSVKKVKHGFKRVAKKLRSGGRRVI